MLTNKPLAKIYHFDSYGKRQEKYERLNEQSLSNVDWTELELKEPYYFFVPKDFGAKEKYDEGFSVSEIFREYNSGIQTKNDILSIHFEKESLENVIFDFQNLSENELKSKYSIKDTSGWNIKDAKEDLLKNEIKFTEILYRPFDSRKTVYTGKSSGFLGRPRDAQSKHMLEENLCLFTTRTIPANDSFNRIFIGKHISDIHIISDQTYFFPLYLYTETGNLETGEVQVVKTPNLDMGIVAEMEKQLGMRFDAIADPLTPKGGMDIANLKEGKENEFLNFKRVETDPLTPKGGMMQTQGNDGEIGRRSEYDKPGYVTADRYSYKYIKETRDELKNNMTQSEEILWEKLKTKQLGYKFRRQHIIDTFIVDFVCLEKNLVIEVDGEIHLTQKEKDSLRTEKLEQLGYKVVRFTNNEVENNIDRVLEAIKGELSCSIPPLGVRGSLPQDGNTSSLALSGDSESGVRGSFTSEDILDYIYAVLHSTSYRETYKEFLKIDFPKIPYPKERENFFSLVALGRELRSFHLLENPKVWDFITGYPVSGDNLVEKVMRKSPDSLESGLGKVYINDSQYFDGVSKEVFEFQIGGYKPAEKYLKDRKGRNLSSEEFENYQKMIVALSETKRIMGEIEGVF